MVDNGFVARVVIVEADFESLMWRDGGNGDLIAPEHRHPRITPQAVAIRLAELTMMGVTVLFCSDPDHALEWHIIYSWFAMRKLNAKY